MRVKKSVLALLLLTAGIFLTVFYGRATQPTNHYYMITEAIQQQNTPEVIRELISRMHESLEKDTDTFPELIRQVEEFTTQTQDLASKAVLHSMVAEMYRNYYQWEAWRINRRTEVAGYIPEDIREWTGNLFDNKITEHIRLSLEPAVLLQQTPVTRFKAILEEGKDSPELRPTLYDFLAYRALQIQPSDQIYEELIAFRRTQPEETALVLAELEYLAYKNRTFLMPVADDGTTQENKNSYETGLDSLLQIYRGKEVSVEIIDVLLNNLEMKAYDPEKGDSVRDEQYRIIRKTLEEFPDYTRIGIIKNRLLALEQPTFSVINKKTVYPGKDLSVQLSYKNIPELKVTVYRSLRTTDEAGEGYIGRRQEKDFLGEVVEEYTFPLTVIKSYRTQEKEILIPIKETGLYECVFSNTDGSVRFQKPVSVSRLATAYKNLRNGQIEVLVTDFQSGKPVTNAAVDYYVQKSRERIKNGTIRTDKDGLAILPDNKNITAYKATLPGDTSMLLTSVYSSGYQEPERESTNITFLTDRGIYRPGQTVFFKGIAYSTKNKDNPSVIAGQSFSVIFRDANGKEITTQTFTSNEYGSFHGEFTIPSGGLNGSFSISSGNSYIYFRVEEYKRPTFKIELDTIRDEVIIGEPMTIRGKAVTYSGINLPSGEVSYRIVRSSFWGRLLYPARTEQVAEGTVSIDSDGTFSIPFTPQKSVSSGLPATFQSYQLYVTVTDSKGESQEEQSHFQVGEAGIRLYSDLPHYVDKDTLNAKVYASTYNNESVTVKGNYTIYKLETTEKEEVFKEGAQVMSGSFESGKPLDKSLFFKLASGRYRIRFTTTDNRGNKAEAENDFILYGSKDKQPPVFTHMWFPTINTQYAPGEPVEFIFGTSDKEAHVLYEIEGKQGQIHREWLVLNNQSKTFRLPYREEFGENFVVSFVFIKEGELYRTSQTFYRKEPDRSLTIRPETFRDKLLPGQNETWTFRITGSDSIPVPAELLANLYDASLDKFASLQWYFNPYNRDYFYTSPFRGGTCFQSDQRQAALTLKTVFIDPFSFDKLDWQGVLSMNQLLSRSAVAYSAAPMVMAKSSVAEAEAVSPDRAQSDRATGGMVLEESVVTGAEEDNGMPLLTPVRSDFRETAFFFPTLQTDANGGVSVTFTIPESNTTWNFKAFAHTKDLKYGFYNNQVVTQKQIMVLPNLPRFLRKKDEVVLSAQVISQTANSLSGKVRLEFFDPVTEQLLADPVSRTIDFTLQPNSSQTVSWDVSVPGTFPELVGMRIIAETNEGSDGEQHLIPVLTNEILVTESTPFYLTGIGEKQIIIPGDKISGSRQPYRMTLELSSNPVWYAVQALPSITQPENDNIVSWFSSYFSNTLAEMIVRSHPRVKNVIEAWSATGGTSETLYSNLQKNEELKNILLEETPWVLDAEKESDQKQRLALLFDMNRANRDKETASEVLVREQLPEGGWSWYKGIQANRRITLYIMKGMAQLVELNAVEYNQQEKQMQFAALNYLDRSILADYESLQKSTQKTGDYIPTEEQIEYLYVRSAYRDVPELGEAREAIRFLTTQAEKQWQKASLYGKAATAFLLHRNGKKESVEEIVNWFRKTATTTDEMGMYWANNRWENRSFISPVEVHVLIMSLFAEVNSDQTETDKMKQWLLNQKRTQIWETTPATVSAIYAILLTGSDWLSETNAITVKWDDAVYNSETGEIATGYLKEVVNGNDITSGHYTITVQKEGSAPAWGAVYNQYFETMEQVEKQKGALHVEKKLFIESNSGTNRQLEPVDENRPLKVGDRVVTKLTIRTDRTMEYVSLKDLRAGCFEPTEQISGLRYSDGLSYYRSPKDLSENFFFEKLPAGTYVIEYSSFVSRAGEFSSGISTLQCMYAPEFTSHTEGSRLIVKE